MMMECWIKEVMENYLQFTRIENLGAQRAHVILAQGNALGMRDRTKAG